jgi:ATP-binding cassette, subfamily C, bacterial exporter for protease/lipase
MAIRNFFKRSELAAALGSFRREFWTVGLFSLAANLMMLAPTIYMLQVFDRVLSSRSELTLLALSLIALFFLGVMSFSEWMRSRVLVRAGVRFDHQLSSRVFDASFESYLNESKAGPSRAFTDLITLRQFLTGQGIFAFFDVPWAPIYLALTFFLHPVLGWSAVAFGVIQSALTFFSNRRTVAPAESASKAVGDAQAYLHSKLRNVEVIESMGMLGNLRRRWRRAQDHALAQNAHASDIAGRAMAVSKFIRYTQQSFSLAVGAVLVIRGELSPGAMVAANMMMARALSPIDQLVSVWRAFATARAAFYRLEELLEQYPERDPNLRRVAPDGEVLLTGVFATAPGRATPILKNIAFAVPAGTVVAVLGPSGSGKSTLARVIMGIWPDRAGEVLIGGLPIEGWNRIELGPHLGYLPQDIELFEGTIGENIARFGELDSEKVIAAARSAGLHEMILHFPKGYDTPIGEAGNLLSGGQKQRIGLARAVYGDPAVLVLDEPNANLDDAGEAALMRTVQQLKAAGKTVFLITHRSGAVAIADRLMILQDGELRMDGPRDAVLAALRPAAPPQTPLPQPAEASATA